MEAAATLRATQPHVCRSSDKRSLADIENAPITEATTPSRSSFGMLSVSMGGGGLICER